MIQSRLLKVVIGQWIGCGSIFIAIEETYGSNVEGESYSEYIPLDLNLPLTFSVTKPPKVGTKINFIMNQKNMIYFIWCPFIAFNATTGCIKSWSVVGRYKMKW